MPLEYPTIEIQPVEDPAPFDAAIASVGRFAWIVFTSTNGVDAFWERLAASDKDSRALAPVSGLRDRAEHGRRPGRARHRRPTGCHASS